MLIATARKPITHALMLLALCLPAFAAARTSTVEVIDVRVAGVSAADESKSIVQVQWRVNPQAGADLKSFEITLEVTYADGASSRQSASAGQAATSARFEVSTLHRSPGRPPAELKSFQAHITANLTETAVKRGTF